MTPDASQRWSELLYAEDIRAGQEYQLGTHTVSERELIDFAAQWDPQGFHTDPAQAEAAAFGGLIASGVHSIAIYQRLAVQGVFFNWSVIAGRTLRDVRFLRPVRPGDKLTGTLSIEDVAFDDRDRALVISAAELTNQDAKPVMRIVADAYVRARPAQAP